MTQEIRLTKGAVTLVDSEDFEWLSQWKWHAHKSRSRWYAVRVAESNAERRRVRMHRLILCPPPDMIVDHINGDSLDNRRSNLRASTNHRNQINSLLISGRTPGVWPARNGRWNSALRLGTFATRDEAISAWKEAYRKVLGDLEF